MATQTTSNRTGATSTSSLAFERFAGVCSLIVGIGGLLYAISFIILKGALLSDLFLMLGGLFSTAVLVALYDRLRETDAAFALWGLLLSITAALGSAIHGGYDLANVLHPVSQVTDAAAAGVPNAVDPRGVLTFLIGGIGLFVIAWLMGRNERFPKMLSYLGYLAAVLLGDNQAADAVAQLETVAKLSPGDLEAARLLGRACLDNGEPAIAITQVQHGSI